MAVNILLGGTKKNLDIEMCICNPQILLFTSPVVERNDVHSSEVIWLSLLTLLQPPKTDRISCCRRERLQGAWVGFLSLLEEPVACSSAELVMADVAVHLLHERVVMADLRNW